MNHPSIVILTGAGISAESGLATFRASDGLWCDHRIEDVATPQAYRRNPALVHEFYNQRRRQLALVSPNAAHVALAELAAKWPGKVTLITQNVDDLHRRTLRQTSPRPDFTFLPMHGELLKARCEKSGKAIDWAADLTEATHCACCTPATGLRPHIVWFGEMPFYMEAIESALAECGLFLSIGTSGNVYPAAGFVQMVRALGQGRTVELNLEPSRGSRLFHEYIQGCAGEIVPVYVKGILAGEII